MADPRTPRNQTTHGLRGDARPDRYPDFPGSKGFDGTSQDAAASIAGHVPHLRRKALVALSELGEAVSIEIAAATGHTREAILPRLSELRAQGLVEPTGARKRNPSGQTAAILRLTARGRHLADRYRHSGKPGEGGAA